MGYHADVYDALKALIEGAVSVPVLDVLALDEVQVNRLSTAVLIQRDAIDLDPHPEVNPSTSVVDQPERWTWTLYVIGGGGAATQQGKSTHVDTLLEQLRTALNAQRPTAKCGPLHIFSEEYSGRHGTGVLYLQRWTHSRLGG
jgi:hypothetical protein